MLFFALIIRHKTYAFLRTYNNAQTYAFLRTYNNAQTDAFLRTYETKTFGFFFAPKIGRKVYRSSHTQGRNVYFCSHLRHKVETYMPTLLPTHQAETYTLFHTHRL